MAQLYYGLMARHRARRRGDRRGRTLPPHRQSSARMDLCPIPVARYPAEAGRYHLWVAAVCPWAARTLAFRALKGIQHVIGVLRGPGRVAEARAGC